MNLRNLFLSAALVAAVGLAVGACNENPTTPNVGVPTQLAASSMGKQSVALTWQAVSGATSYQITITPQGGTSLTPVTSATNSYLATGLQEGTAYTFAVAAVTADGTGSPATLTWAGATRYLDNGSTMLIRMYEKASSTGSGLTLDPSLGGPKNVSVRAGTTGKAQLALYVAPETGGNPDTLIIGPAYAITEYKVAAGNDFTKIDSSVYISGTTYAGGLTSLDTWFLNTPLSSLISNNGNVSAYAIPMKPTSPGPQGFVVRTGTGIAPNQYHYARIVIMSGGGSILQGTYPNRYVLMQVSYQETANLPYAKPAPGAFPGVPSIPATIGH